jgi:hypothetical protein
MEKKFRFTIKDANAATLEKVLGISKERTEALIEKLNSFLVGGMSKAQADNVPGKYSVGEIFEFMRDTIETVEEAMFVSFLCGRLIATLEGAQMQIQQMARKEEKETVH